MLFIAADCTGPLPLEGGKAPSIRGLTYNTAQNLVAVYGAFAPGRGQGP